MNTLRIGTRNSPLALWQAYYVRDALLAAHNNLQVEIVEIISAGDKHLETPLAAIGGKGLFLKELEQALLADEVDIAVHSMKDVTVHLPDGLIMPVICERANPGDAFVSNQYKNLSELPNGARVGTCSLRRKSQLAARYPHLDLVDLRGNVNTRLRRLDEADFDAIILAVAGLERLNFDQRISSIIDRDVMLPAVGQGAVGIECRANDEVTQQLIAPLNHVESALCVRAERAANEQLGGGCHVPVAAFATLDGETIHLKALVAEVSGARVLSAEASGSSTNPKALGDQVGRELIQQGADSLLKVVYEQSMA